MRQGNDIACVLEDDQVIYRNAAPPCQACQEHHGDGHTTATPAPDVTSSRVLGRARSRRAIGARRPLVMHLQLTGCARLGDLPHLIVTCRTDAVIARPRCGAWGTRRHHQCGPKSVPRPICLPTRLAGRHVGDEG